MRIPRIYTPQPLSHTTLLTLDALAANHVGKVLRMKPGEQIYLFNGTGDDYLAELSEVSKKTVVANVLKKLTTQHESPLSIHIGQCLSRGERMDYAIQKATEMGVTQITPLFSTRCEVKLAKERQEKKLQHWRQIAISACEQCGRNLLPEIHAPLPIDQWLAQRSEALRLVLHHHAATPLGNHKQPHDIALLIGPEGGLTEEEVSLANQHQFHSTTFGPRVLRTETAPVAALAVLQYCWGDWR
ncbi:16S rRNA (uracil(1498)-N(3))-methyltransferase [Zooshikella ganghwensis]|uniref:16S rRNA (uracil(1498)-N(3))-methyltransferase n=1 Tax=Zooshikella ganghwensis TaxID=202772 RepID=UPI0004247513|nr:16S rRNA (uracil(1498)-N(3))-methyltransferase [Zooshikella ganghwensis]